MECFLICLFVLFYQYAEYEWMIATFGVLLLNSAGYFKHIALLLTKHSPSRVVADIDTTHVDDYKRGLLPIHNI